MEKEELAYTQAAEVNSNAEKSQMFGKPCYKIGGKAFVSFFENEMVFKLDGETHREALALSGAQLFDPSKKGRPMKAWVQVPFEFSQDWKKYSKAAYDFVESNL